jgi:hypothetical protein
MLSLIVAVAGVHASISAGVGTAYDYAGVRLEMRVDHLALSAAVGVPMVGINLVDPGGAQSSRGADVFPALSLRYIAGEGRGVLASVAWTNHGYARNYDDPCCYDSTARLQTLTLTVGYRFRNDSGLFFEVAGGGGAAIRQGHPSVSGHDSTPGPFRRDVYVIPDLALGVGYEF